MLIADDLDKLLEILPDFVRFPLEQDKDRKSLIEIVMDLGRRPEARFPSGPKYLSTKPISWQDLDFCIRKIGNFSSDNRSGIERTLHRISSLRNRKGIIIGLTCRVGRAIFGTINIIRDLLERRDSLLLLGRPGVGKTTAIREIARILADEMERRVVIIDTSNEIAGDGDIPHPAIGRARRMQVLRPELQHQVMIEAVENHMPEVIIIDEIGTELEALAARTIAERGVQLVGTAHGNYLESLIKNPILADLVGGIQHVTLGDDEAKRRGSQKSILERKAAPAFKVAIEIHERSKWIVHENVDEAVDQLLQGSCILTQQRLTNKKGQIFINCEPFLTQNATFSKVLRKNIRPTPLRFQQSYISMVKTSLLNKNIEISVDKISNCLKEKKNNSALASCKLSQSIYLYPYFVSMQQVKVVIDTLGLPILITQDVMNADVILALRSSVKKNNRLRQIAKSKRITVYTIYSSTIPHITRALRKVLNLNLLFSSQTLDLYDSKSKYIIDILEEAREAIEKIVLGQQQMVELSSCVASVRKLQHHLVKLYNVRARSFGEEPHRRLRIFP
uniref:R3H domain-containing protein n=1 Tax=Porolithon onkodes TaxID=231751 RepID=A0A2Z2KVG6_9FLOR|nr:hypothetical protein [Porolithon onkodes]ASB29727.1 hypothetical protein [Porolithon onkodes]